MSEIDKSIAIIRPYLNGNILELGSGGWPCVDHAVQVDVHRFHNPPHPPVQLVTDAFGSLPFRDGFFDCLVASHLLEDVLDWQPVLREWTRVVRSRGHVIIQVPDRSRYRAAVAAGQPDNKSHRHESFPGELTDYYKLLGGFDVIRDGFEPAGDYNVLGIFRKR